MPRIRSPCELKVHIHCDNESGPFVTATGLASPVAYDGVSVVDDHSGDGLGQAKLDEVSTDPTPFTFHLTPHITISEAALQIIALLPHIFPQFLESTLTQMISDGVDLYLKRQASTSGHQETVASPLADELDYQSEFFHAYASLTNSRHFDSILDKEMLMANEIMELRKDHDFAMNALKDKHSQDIFDRRRLAGSTNQMASDRQREEADLIAVTFASRLDDVRASQRVKFRKYVLALYRQHNSTGAGTIQTIDDPEFDAVVSSLQEMGFTYEQASGAATMANKNLDQAIVLLLESPDKVGDAVEKSPARSVTIPKLTFRPSPKPVINWLDRAKAQIDDLIVDPREVSTEPSQVESFTVSFGSHVRHTHNIMIQSSRILDLVSWPADVGTRRGIHAQTCATLYSRGLFGIVVLVAENSISNYQRGIFENSDLFTACEWESTELHFTDIETQIRIIQSQFHNEESGTRVIKEGDFFVTRHSNLPTTHLVFHLVYSQNRCDSELTQRTPIISSLRSILRLASKYDVKTLSLPLLLLPEESAKIAANSVTANIFNMTSKALSRSSSLQALAQFATGSSSQTASQTNPSYMQVSNGKMYSAASLPAQYQRRAEIVLKTLKAHLLERGHGAGLSDDIVDTATGFTRFTVPPELILKGGDRFWTSIVEMVRVIFRTI